MDLAKWRVCRLSNCAPYCVDVDFVDIEPTTFNISTPVIEVKITTAERNGTLSKLLIVVYHGDCRKILIPWHD